MKNKAQKKAFKAWNELVVLAVLIPLVLVLGMMLVKWSDLQVDPVSIWPAEAELPSVSEERVADIRTESSATPEITMSAVELMVENGGEKRVVLVSAQGTVSVAEVMQNAVREKQITMEAKDYGESMGILVESIDNVANDNGQKRYWYLYVDGKLSPTGASQTFVKAGSQISWKYEQEKDE